MFYKDSLFEANPHPHSPHGIIPTLIKSNSYVLDVGCNTGFLAKKLLSKHVITDGIDINTEALQTAKENSRHVYKRDLYKGLLDLPNIKYDYIIFADVLEHLPRPDLILIDAKKYLRPNGYIIASIPNIARLEIRLQLLFGKFNYSPGILSPDHLRFFTKESAQNMFKRCGYVVEKVIPTGLGYILPIFQNLTAFQFIYIVRIKC